MTGSGFEDRHERALLAGLNLSLVAPAATVRKLVTLLTGWSSLEASERNSPHPSVAVLGIRGVGNNIASSSVSAVNT